MLFWAVDDTDDGVVRQMLRQALDGVTDRALSEEAILQVFTLRLEPLCHPDCMRDLGLVGELLSLALCRPPNASHACNAHPDRMSTALGRRGPVLEDHALGPMDTARRASVHREAIAAVLLEPLEDVLVSLDFFLVDRSWRGQRRRCTSVRFSATFLECHPSRNYHRSPSLCV